MRGRTSDFDILEKKTKKFTKSSYTSDESSIKLYKRKESLDLDGTGKELNIFIDSSLMIK